MVTFCAPLTPPPSHINPTTKDSDLWKTMEVTAEALVKARIRGTRKGLPDAPNHLHSLRVRDLAMRLNHWDDPDYDLFLAALLHDIVEDGGVTLNTLAALGFTDRTVPLVDLCSHSLAIEGSAERWIAMMTRLSHENSIEAWRIKLADLTDNLTQSRGLSPDNRRFTSRSAF